ncbi:hypothetical protein ABH935_001881 [Catenulispora sp. GAS73]|uniref:hypothetical protein n=1 Tax=Catenulispora sp. GAS73 TaxID=3156269 RepID=UPI003517ED24
MADVRAAGRDAMRSLAASLGDRANEMAAAGQVADVPALWEDAIAGLRDEESRALITLAYAWYQALHGEVEHGVRLAVGLRDCPLSSVRGQIRVLVRNRVRVEPDLVGQTWFALTETDLPSWASLSDRDIDAVGEWLTAASWEDSRAIYDADVSGIRSQDIDDALAEIALGDPRFRAPVAVHRAVLVLGVDVGYRCLSDARETARVAGEVVAAGDWSALRACGTIELTVHGLGFLGGVHGVAAELMAGGGGRDLAISPLMSERIAVVARDAEPWERAQAASDLAAVGDGSLVALLAAIPDSPER